ncbi:MAG: tyrosine-protein phosphatase [Novosphingobium sp.]|nr:tyrosine-protein phosphatase [Novosphingobium sp.]
MSDWRTIPMTGVHNFRDYGGYALIGGGRLRRGLLWRSGQHAGATDADLDKVAAVGLASVFDLRTSRERELYPCRRPDQFGAQVSYSADPDRPKFAPHVEAARQAGGVSDVEYIHMMMSDTYTRIAFRPELLAMTRDLAEALTRGEGPSLVNCMAGKDRTGIAVAAIQLAAGVHRDDVMADYLLTNTAGDNEARIRAGMETVKGVNNGMTDEAARAIMGVEPEYLEAAFAAIEEKHGSLDAWLAEALGLDEAAREKLRAAISE